MSYIAQKANTCTNSITTYATSIYNLQKKSSIICKFCYVFIYTLLVLFCVINEIEKTYFANIFFNGTFKFVKLKKDLDKN